MAYGGATQQLFWAFFLPITSELVVQSYPKIWGKNVVISIVWNLQKFCVMQILREINFMESLDGWKINAILTVLQAVNDLCQKWQFLRL